MTSRTRIPSGKTASVCPDDNSQKRTGSSKPAKSVEDILAPDTLTTGARTRARTNNSPTLGEYELLNVLQGCIVGMSAFVNDNRNVHKELKESIDKSYTLVTQLVKLRKNVVRGLVVPEGTGTQTPATTTVETGTQSPCWWGIDGGYHECQRVGRSEKKGQLKAKDAALKLREISGLRTVPNKQEGASWAEESRQKDESRPNGEEIVGAT